MLGRIREVWTELEERVMKNEGVQKTRTLLQEMQAHWQEIFAPQRQVETEQSAHARFEQMRLRSLREWFHNICIRRDHYDALVDSRGRPAIRRQQRFLKETVAADLRVLAGIVRKEIREALKSGDDIKAGEMQKFGVEISDARVITRTFLRRVMRLEKEHYSPPNKGRGSM